MRRRMLYRYDLIDAAIKEQGLSNEKLARMIRCNPQTISRMRQPGYSPTLKTFAKVCSKLDLPFERVMDVAA